MRDFELVKYYAKTKQYAEADGGYMAFDSLQVLGERCEEGAAEINERFKKIASFSGKRHVIAEVENKYNVMVMTTAKLIDILDRLESGELV